jgi:hypothetical protein
MPKPTTTVTINNVIPVKNNVVPAINNVIPAKAGTSFGLTRC